MVSGGGSITSSIFVRVWPLPTSWPQVFLTGKGELGDSLHPPSQSSGTLSSHIALTRCLTFANACPALLPEPCPVSASELRLAPSLPTQTIGQAEGNPCPCFLSGAPGGYVLRTPGFPALRPPRSLTVLGTREGEAWCLTQKPEFQGVSDTPVLL